MAKEMRFDQLEIGDRFTWKDEEYKKVATDNLPRYGWVNCQGRAFYEEDTGHRFIDADTPVQKIESPNPDRGMGAHLRRVRRGAHS